MIFRPVVYYKPDDGKGGGAGAGNSTVTPAGGTGNEPGGLATGTNNGTPPTGAITFASEADYQKDIEEKLKVRLEREKKKSDEASKKAAEDAIAEAAKKNGEWQKVAEQREAELAEAAKKLADLDPVQQQAKRYEEALKKNLESQRTGLPESIIKLLDKLDVADQLEWLSANKEAIMKKTPSGVPPTPPPDGNPNISEEDKKKYESQTRRYF